MAVLPGVLGCRILRRTGQVRLGSNSLRFPGGTAIFTVWRRHFVKYAACKFKFKVILIRVKKRCYSTFRFCPTMFNFKFKLILRQEKIYVNNFFINF
jgi:hypothetical protein